MFWLWQAEKWLQVTLQGAAGPGRAARLLTAQEKPFGKVAVAGAGRVAWEQKEVCTRGQQFKNC